MSMWKSDLRWHDGRLHDRLLTNDAIAAEVHFRALLSRDDLIGQLVAARIVSPVTRRAVYFSRFDREFGDGRIHADAPLDIWRSDDGSADASSWTPPPSINWNAATPELLKTFPRAMGWTRAQTAAALNVPVSTYDRWCEGRAPTHEKVLRLALRQISI